MFRNNRQPLEPNNMSVAKIPRGVTGGPPCGGHITVQARKTVVTPTDPPRRLLEGFEKPPVPAATPKIKGVASAAVRHQP